MLLHKNNRDELIELGYTITQIENLETIVLFLDRLGTIVNGTDEELGDICTWENMKITYYQKTYKGTKIKAREDLDLPKGYKILCDALSVNIKKLNDKFNGITINQNKRFIRVAREINKLNIFDFVFDKNKFEHIDINCTHYLNKKDLDIYAKETQFKV